MSYFLCETSLSIGESSFLVGDEAQHLLNVRRVKVGESFEVQDSAGHRFEAILEQATRHTANFYVQRAILVSPPSPLTLELWLGLPKEKSLDWILQKVTELGVSSIVLFKAVHTAKKISAPQEVKLLQRWQRIVLEACKQCGRQFPPKVLFFKDLSEAFNTQTDVSNQWIFATETNGSLKSLKLAIDEVKNPITTLRIIIGPEGGWHEDELTQALQQNSVPIRLGSRILRTETAVIALSSILQFLFGDLNESVNLEES